MERESSVKNGQTLPLTFFHILRLREDAERMLIGILQTFSTFPSKLILK